MEWKRFLFVPLELVFACILENRLSYAMPAVVACCYVNISSVNIKILILLLSSILSPSHQHSLESSVFIQHTKEAAPGRTDISAVIRQLFDISVKTKRTLEIIIIKKMKFR